MSWEAMTLYYIIAIIVGVIAYFNYGLHELAGAHGWDCSRIASRKP